MLDCNTKRQHVTLFFTMLHLPLDPFLPLLGCPAAVVLAAVGRGHLEAVLLAEDGRVKRLDFHLLVRQIYGMHGRMCRQEGLMRPRRSHARINQLPARQARKTF